MVSVSLLISIATEHLNFIILSNAVVGLYSQIICATAFAKTLHAYLHKIAITQDHMWLHSYIAIYVFRPLYTGLLFSSSFICVINLMIGISVQCNYQ